MLQIALSCSISCLLAVSALAQSPGRAYDDEDKRQIELVRRFKERLVDPRSFFAAVFDTQIIFYGKVVDQDGIAIEGARVTYSPSVDFELALAGRNPRFETYSDKGGLFTIKTKGADLSIEVDKAGYRHVSSDISSRSRGPVRPTGPSINPGDRVGSREKVQYFEMHGYPELNHRPVAGRPVQFTLRKLGEIYNLLVVDKRLSPRSNGEPLRVSLNGNDGSGHEIQIICKSDFGRTPVQAGVPHRYAWSFEILVENGGIQEMKDKEGFDAPEGGYVPKLTVASKDASAVRWSNDFRDKAYYVRFDDGVSARFKCQGGTEHGNGKDKPFVYLDGLLNPDPRSRSLETLPIK
jgi:hypothetical protein